MKIFYLKFDKFFNKDYSILIKKSLNNNSN